MVIDHGAVPIFVKLLGSPSDDVREQVYCLEIFSPDYCNCVYLLGITGKEKLIFFQCCRLCGLWEMLLVIRQDAVILSSTMGL